MGCSSHSFLRVSKLQFPQPIQPDIMKSTQTLHDLGQSLWLDNITRDLLNSGTLKRYLGEMSVTG